MQRNRTTCMNAVIGTANYNTEQGDREGAPIHMPMIRLETVENHRMYCLMPSDNQWLHMDAVIRL